MDYNELKTFFENDRFATSSGIEILEIRKGFCKTMLRIKSRHLNAANVVQGGAIFTLADLAFAVASNSHGMLSLAVNANISFIKGKSSGVLYAIAEEICEPGKLGVYNVMVTDENDDVIACFNGTVYRKNVSIMDNQSESKPKKEPEKVTTVQKSGRTDFISSVIKSTKSKQSGGYKKEDTAKIESLKIAKKTVTDKNILIEAIIKIIKNSGRGGRTYKEILEVMKEYFPHNDPKVMKIFIQNHVPYHISKRYFLLEKVGDSFRMLQ